MKIIKLIILSLTLFLIPTASTAQPGCKLRTFTMADGLPSSTISTSAVAPNGMLWIATWNGLCNYDGYRFNTFINPIGAGQVLTSNRLHALAPTNNGDVWITTFDSRLYKLSAKEQRYIDFQPELEKIGLQGYETSNVVVLPNDVVWILGKNGTNVRIENDEMKIEPTGLAEAEICMDVKFINEREWIIGEKTFRLYNGSKNHKTPNANIFATGKEYIIVSDKVFTFNAETENLTQLPMPQDIEKINTCCQQTSGDVILATNSGLYSISKDNHAVKRLTEGNMTNVFSDSKERIWSILESGEVLLINRKNNTQSKLSCSQPETWPEISRREALFHEDLQSTVWLISNGTFCYYDEAGKKLVPTDFRTNGGASFPTIQISKELADNRKNLWFTMARNLYVLSFHNYSFHYTPIVNSIEMRSVVSIGNGNILVGSRDGQLSLVSADGKLKGFYAPDGSLHAAEYSAQLPSSKIIKFTDKGIYALYRDKKGDVWVGTRGNGIFRLSGNENSYHVEHFTKENTPGIACDDYYDINEDSKGRLWFCTYLHGFMLRIGDKFYSEENCKAFVLQQGDLQKVRRINSDKNGTIWLSTADGIITIDGNFSSPEKIRMKVKSYNPEEEHPLIARDVLQTLCCTKSNSTFISTMGGGVQKLETDEIITRSEIGNVQSMIEDKQGFVWAIGENTIHRYSADGKELNVFSSGDWGKDLEMSEAKSCYDRNGSNFIYVPVMGGVIRFNPEMQKFSSFKPTIVFSGIQYQGDESITPLLNSEELSLPTDKHNAVVYFSALDYSGNSLVRYAYRIREIENEWTYVGSEHCAPLSNLPAGDFTLEVRSTNSEGIWMDNNTEIKIHVVPTFWETPWAMIIYAILIIAILYAVFYVYQLKNTARIEKEIKERQLRFFTNISHQLRTPLTLIGGPVSEVLKTEELSDQARNYLKFVENNSDRMLSLVNKSLDLQKLQQLNEDIEQSPMPQTEPVAGNEESNAKSELATTTPDTIEEITILVVEDNDELRYFLSTALSTHYKIIEAENGKIGLKLALEKQPDFIITDIMMPEMDGITMIKHIKADNAICHIPIIILSARTADVYRIEGLQEGADDYITKPFSIAYLQLRVESIIHNRKMLQETWRKKLTENNASSDVTTDQGKDSLPETSAKDSKDASSQNSEQKEMLTQADSHFVEQLTAFVKDNLGNEDLVIEDIAKALGISRSVLYGKVKTIFGYSPNDFLKNLRISRACHLLVNNPEMNISEIAYAVGYTDPKYFARNFKQYTGKSPSEYRKTS